MSSCIHKLLTWYRKHQGEEFSFICLRMSWLMGYAWEWLCDTDYFRRLGVVFLNKGDLFFSRSQLLLFIFPPLCVLTRKTKTLKFPPPFVSLFFSAPSNGFLFSFYREVAHEPVWEPFFLLWSASSCLWMLGVDLQGYPTESVSGVHASGWWWKVEGTWLGMGMARGGWERTWPSWQGIGWRMCFGDCRMEKGGRDVGV